MGMPSLRTVYVMMLIAASYHDFVDVRKYSRHGSRSSVYTYNNVVVPICEPWLIVIF